MEKLSPRDALQVLDQAAGFYKGSRQEHQTLVAAVLSIRELIELHEKTVPPVARAEYVELSKNGDE